MTAAMCGRRSSRSNHWIICPRVSTSFNIDVTEHRAWS